MITVYFESNCYAEKVAVFENEEVYLVCMPALEKLAKNGQMLLTESICEEKI